MRSLGTVLKAWVTRAQLVAAAPGGIRGGRDARPVLIGPPPGPVNEHADVHPFQGTAKFQGLKIDVENRAGTFREGVGPDGMPWSTFMHYDYGEIRGTEGADGDKVDVYLGPDGESDKVFVVHQNHPDTGTYDEDKVMLAFPTREDAVEAYLGQYDRPEFFGGVDELTVGEFKAFLAGKGNAGRKITVKGAVRAARAARKPAVKSCFVFFVKATQLGLFPAAVGSPFPGHVRGHSRTLGSGRVVRVKPHVTGKPLPGQQHVALPEQRAGVEQVTSASVPSVAPKPKAPPKIKRVLSVVDTRQYEEGPDDKWYPVPGSGDARECSRCGKVHEVHATVLLDDGTQDVVGTGCASRDSMGIDAQVKSATSAAKTLQRLRHEVAAHDKRRAEYLAAVRAVEALPMPEPQFYVETLASGQKQELVRVGDARGYRIPEFMARTPDNFRERVEAARGEWQNNRLRERGFPNPVYVDHELKRRLEKYERAAARLQEPGQQEVSP